MSGLTQEDKLSCLEYVLSVYVDSEDNDMVLHQAMCSNVQLYCLENLYSEAQDSYSSWFKTLDPLKNDYLQHLINHKEFFGVLLWFTYGGSTTQTRIEFLKECIELVKQNKI